MAKLPGAYELMATAASPAINFTRGLLGYQDPFRTQTMQDRMTELESKKGTTGSIGYEDYGLPVSKPGGRFTGGLFDLALSNPVDFGLAGSVGRYGFGPEGRTGLKYDFTPDQDTGSTGNVFLDYINRGGFKNTLANLNLTGMAHAAMPNQRFKQQQLMNRRKQQMQETIRQHEAAEAAKQKAAADAAAKAKADAAAAAKYTAPRHHQDVSRNRGDHTAPTFRNIKDEGPGVTASSGMHGGKHYADGGLINFYRYGGFI